MPRSTRAGRGSWLDQSAAYLAHAKRTLPKVCGDAVFIAMCVAFFIADLALITGFVIWLFR
jgi:hypothetical protein